MIEVEQQAVGQHPRRDPAGLEPEDLGAVDRGALPGLGGRHGGRVAGQRFADQGGELDLLEHIQIVVGRAAVGADPDGNPPLPQAPVRKGAGTELHVGGRQMGDPDPVGGQEILLLGIQPDGVGGQDVGAEKTQLPQITHRGLTVLLQAILHLPFGLRQVNMEQQITLPGKLRQPDQGVPGDGVDGVRSQGQLDEPGSGRRSVKQLLGKSAEMFGLGGVAEIDKGRGEHRPHTHLLHRPQGAGQMPVHVGKTGGAALDHLQAGQLDPPIDILLGQLALHGPDMVLKPGVQLQVIGITPQQGHGRVGVGVDQGGNNGPVGGVDHRFGLGLDGRGHLTDIFTLDQNIHLPVVQGGVADQNAHSEKSSFSG